MKKNESNPAYPNTMKTIAVDFDGVIHDTSLGFNKGRVEGIPVKSVMYALKYLSEKGFRIVVFSCKARRDRPLVNGKTGVELVKQWLYKYNLLQYVSEITAEKPPCILLIDDNAYRFDNWMNVLHFISEMNNAKK